MPKYSDTSYLHSGEISEETIAPAGVPEVMSLPPGVEVDDAVRDMFEMLASEGQGRYRTEDVPSLLKLARLEVALLVLDDQMLSELLNNPTGGVKTKNNMIARSDKLDRRVTVLRDKLGCTPAARFSVASRRRGSATYKANGAARTIEQAEAQAIAAVEERKSDRPA